MPVQHVSAQAKTIGKRQVAVVAVVLWLKINCKLKTKRHLLPGLWHCRVMNMHRCFRRTNCPTVNQQIWSLVWFALSCPRTSRFSRPHDPRSWPVARRVGIAWRRRLQSPKSHCWGRGGTTGCQAEKGSLRKQHLVKVGHRPFTVAAWPQTQI